MYNFYIDIVLSSPLSELNSSFGVAVRRRRGRRAGRSAVRPVTGQATRTASCRQSAHSRDTPSGREIPHWAAGSCAERVGAAEGWQGLGRRSSQRGTGRRGRSAEQSRPPGADDRLHRQTRSAIRRRGWPMVRTSQMPHWEWSGQHNHCLIFR